MRQFFWKTCCKCRKTKKVNSFGTRGGKKSHLLQPWCKQCTADNARAKNPSRVEKYRQENERLRSFLMTIRERPADAAMIAQEALK